MQNKEAKGFVFIENRTDDPSSPHRGRIWVRKIYKKIFICVIIFLNLNDYALAEDINWCLDENSSAEKSASGSDYWAENGDADAVRDNNTATSYTINCFAPPVSNAVVSAYSYTCMVTLAQAIRLNRVEIVHAATVNNGTENWYVDIYYNGSWYNALSGSGSFERTDSNSSGWNDVIKIRVRSDGSCHNVQTLQTGFASHTTSELRAWGPPPYVDIGLRAYDGTENISIACEPVGTLTSPLRIAKNGIIYGVVLVEPSDGNASKIKIKTSSTIKALRKL